MTEHLEGHTGAVGDVELLRGLAVVTHCMPEEPERRAKSPSPQVAQVGQPREDADIEPVLLRAIEVIGDRDEALRWLGTPVRALDYATPISRVHDRASRDLVLSVLSQLEHGIL